MKSFKLILLVLAVSVLAMGAFASGSSEAGAKAEGPKKATVWLKKTFNPDANAQMQARVAEWGEKNGVDVEIEVIPTKSMVQKFNTAVEAKMLPDVNFLTAAMTTSFGEKGLLKPVDDLIVAIEKANGELVEKTKISVTMGGKAYAVPQWTGSGSLYYRKDLFAAAGLTRPPKTWEELKEYAIKLSQPDKDIYGAGFAFGPGGDCYNQGSSLIYSYGGSILKKDGKTSNFNTPQTVEALSVWVDMFNEGGLPPSVVNWDDGGNNKGYLSGQCAMVINTGSIANVLFKPENKELLDKTGFAQYVGGPKGNLYKHTGNFMAIFKESRAPKIGEEIIKYVMDYSWYRDWMASISPVSMPVYVKSRQDKAWTDDPINKVFLDQSSAQQQFGYPGFPTGAHGELQNLRIISKTLQRIVVDKVSVEQAVKETDEFIQAHLKKMYGK
jgi:multiple sugar transport system substrate-binding protein